MRSQRVGKLLAAFATALAAAGILALASSGASGQEPTPRQLTSISAGDAHTCAIETDSTPICWGRASSALAVPADVTVTQISAGSAHVCAVQTDNTPICWGSNAGGQSTPPEGITVTRIAAGTDHTCAVQTDNTPICWGSNFLGDLTPPDDITVTQISVGGLHACAVQTDNTPICWGFEGDEGRATPPPGVKVTQVSAGRYYTCAVQTDDTPICWGYSYPASTPPDGISITHVSTHDFSNNTCAVQTDGTPICWGLDSFGESTPPDGVTVTELAVGSDHACALQTDNTPICWGSNADGRSTPPLLNVDTVATDDSYSIVVGSPTRMDLCANDIIGTPPGRVTKIDGWYGPGLSRLGCVVSGRPTTAGTYTYNYLLTDNDGNSDTAQVIITVRNNPVDIAPDASDDFISGTVGTFLSFDICANDDYGNGPLQPRRVSGWYGPGLTRTNWCTVSGTPTTAGTYNYTYRLTDDDGDTDTANVRTVIQAAVNE